MLSMLSPAQNFQAVGGCRPAPRKLLPLSEDGHNEGDDDDDGD